MSDLLKGDAKAAGVLHPESRKAAQMGRAMRKEASKDARAKVKHRARSEHGLFCRFVQAQLLREEHAGKKNLSYREISDLLTEWAHRFDDELAELRSGGTRKTREHEVQLAVDAELQKLRTGYVCPDLRQNRVVRMLREWDNTDYDALAKFDQLSATFKQLPPDVMDVDEDN